MHLYLYSNNMNHHHHHHHHQQQQQQHHTVSYIIHHTYIINHTSYIIHHTSYIDYRYIIRTYNHTYIHTFILYIIHTYIIHTSYIPIYTKMHATTGSRPFSCITTQQGYGVLHPAGGSTEQLHQTCLCKRQRISKRGFPKGHTIWNVWILGSNMTSYSRNMLRITTDQAGWVIATWFFPKGDREKVDGSYPKGWELPSYQTKDHWTTTCSDIWSQICGHYEQPMFELSRHQIDTRACQPTTPTFLRPQALKRSRALN